MKTKDIMTRLAPRIRPQILSISETRLLLQRGIDPVTAPRALLQLFAAHRRGEVDEQRWENIQPGAPIQISTDRDLWWRHVPFHLVLIPWLAPYLRLSPKGLIDPAPQRSRRRLALAFRNLGVKLHLNLWRRSYAAHRFAITRSWPAVALEMGLHARFARESFLSPVNDSDAEAFFGLTPTACGRSNWADEVAASFAAKSMGIANDQDQARATTADDQPPF